MPQHDYDVANQAGAGVRADLNSVLAAIVSNNSGATEPATKFAYQWWADTTTGLLKIRNAANTAWVTVGTLGSANLGLIPASIIDAAGDLIVGTAADTAARLAKGTALQVLRVNAGATALEWVDLLSQENTWTKAQSVLQVTLTDAANIATDASLSNVFAVTLAGNRTLDNPTNLVAGQTIIWNINQDATGSRALAYGTLFKFPGGIVPVLSTTASAKDTLTGAYDGTILRCSMQKAFA